MYPQQKYLLINTWRNTRRPGCGTFYLLGTASGFSLFSPPLTELRMQIRTFSIEGVLCYRVVQYIKTFQNPLTLEIRCLTEKFIYRLRVSEACRAKAVIFHI